MLWEQYDEISTNMSIKVTKLRIVMLKPKDWLMIESTCTNEKQTRDEQNRSGCVDVWIWVVGRSGSIPPPVAPDRQLVSVRLPPPPSLACPPRCLSAFSQYHPHSHNRRCSALPWSKFTFSSVALGQDRDQLEHSELSDWDSFSFLKDHWSIVHRWCNKGWV